MNKEMRKNKRENSGGFTLIELLIVVGLLGGLAAMILPKLSADRADALAGVDNYNAGGTARTLSMFNQLTGEFPDGLHTGLTTNSVDDAWTLSGMPEGMSKTTSSKVSGAISALTDEEIASFEEAGIDTVCYAYGLNETNLTTSVVVLKPSENASSWTYGSDKEAVSFNGVELEDIMDEDGDGTDDYSIVMLYVTPTASWEASNDGNSDWGEGNFEISVDLPAQSSLPTANADGDEVDFAYYAAWFKLDLAGEDAAELLGITGTGGSPWNE
jgi:prepilin-type N-terminal cleavage/methylation domain-containing protein